MWFLKKSRIWLARNFNLKSSEHEGSMSSILGCNDTSSQSKLKHKEKNLKVGCRATQMGAFGIYEENSLMKRINQKIMLIQLMLGSTRKVVERDSSLI